MSEKQALRIDIISDIMCPWCIVGYKRLESVFPQFEDQLEFDVHWHPFELNPQMAAEGENLSDHIMRKYGSTKEQGAENRARLKAFGDELGFAFNYSDEMRIYNTFKAHQLLRWAQDVGKQHELKMALFEAFFTHGKDVSDEAVLLDIVGKLGLDVAEAGNVLKDGRFAQAVRQEEQFWMQNGVQGVPAVVFDQKYLVTGAHNPEGYAEMISKLIDMKKKEL